MRQHCVDVYTVGNHFLPALYNEDFQELNRADLSNLRRFTKDLATYGTVQSLELTSADPYFGWCEISAIKGNTVDIVVHYRGANI